jgi:hypothetical protein
MALRVWKLIWPLRGGTELLDEPVLVPSRWRATISIRAE